MARHAHVSERTFARRFVAETGRTPLQWLLHQRVLVARELLETTPANIDEIAQRCGFGTPANLRTHFRRQVATTPTSYRNAFLARR
jgi:transcriptional regulator GlxA family with amidase domain